MPVFILVDETQRQRPTRGRDDFQEAVSARDVDSGRLTPPGGWHETKRQALKEALSERPDIRSPWRHGWGVGFLGLDAPDLSVRTEAVVRVTCGLVFSRR